MGLNQFPQAFSFFKTFLPVVLLCPAALQDLEKREVDASTWLPILLLGLSTLVLELASSMLLETFFKLFQAVSLIGLLLLLRLYGPGDALILAGICLTHVSTTRPLLQGRFLQLFYPDFSLTVLLNAEVLSFTTIASNLLRNLRSGAWRTLPKEEPLGKRVASMLLLKTVSQGEAAGSGGCRTVSAKQTVPMALFILLSYVATLLFGSLIPVSG
ncbi:MAG: prepilin peptidase [Thermoproteota archaeon]